MQSRRVKVAGRGMLAPVEEIPQSLEEMIYTVTSEALAHAGLEIGDVDGACMAASDLNDGRAISTMTLTGSTGSFHKTEMRMCNDSLSAALFAAVEIASGAADALIVCSWSKFSDAEPGQIAALSMEPVYHRGLGFHPDAIAGMWRSRDSGTATITADASIRPSDVAVAAVLTRPDHSAPSLARLVGFGASMGTYLRPDGPFLRPLRDAAQRACEDAGTDLSSVPRIVVAGMPGTDVAAITQEFSVPDGRIDLYGDGQTDLGYAAGLTALITEVDLAASEQTLVVSAGGIGQQNTFAILLEKS